MDWIVMSHEKDDEKPHYLLVITAGCLSLTMCIVGLWLLVDGQHNVAESLRFGSTDALERATMQFVSGFPVLIFAIGAAVLTHISWEERFMETDV